MLKMNKKRVIIDSDIGDDIDDAYALAFALNSPELGIEAVLTNNRFVKDRARIASKLLALAGREDVPVFEGLKEGKGKLSQKEFSKDFEYESKDFSDFLDYFPSLIGKKINYISLGSLSNLASLLDSFLSIKDKLDLFIMGGSLAKDYQGEERLIPEWNISSDIEASRRVFSSNFQITMVGLEATWDLKLGLEAIEQIRRSKRPLNQGLACLYSEWKRAHPRRPILYDPFTVGILIDPTLASFEKVPIKVDSKGRTVKRKGGKEVKIAMKSEKERFIPFFMDRILSKKE